MFLTFTGQNFVPGGTTVTVNSATGITVGTVSVSPDRTTLKVTLTIAAGAALGVRTVTLSTGGTPVMKNITINAAPAAPTLTGISPSSGPQNGFLTATL